MHDVNWWLMTLAFVLGLLLTFAMMIRKVTREVPVTHSVSAAVKTPHLGKPDLKADLGKVAGTVTAAGAAAAAGVSAKLSDAADKVGGAADKAADKLGDTADKAADTLGGEADKVINVVGGKIDEASDKLDATARKAGDALDATAAKVDAKLDAADAKLAAAGAKLDAAADTADAKLSAAAARTDAKLDAAEATADAKMDAVSGKIAAKFAAIEDVPAGPYGKGSAKANADGSGPAGWLIKGNADSMLYHTTESRWYGQTIAEVWFADEESARKAGFLRWDSGQGGDAELVVAAIADVPAGPYGKGSATGGADGSGPAGWLIKGNADSMLFHGPDSPAYEQTIAEVWFFDEATARSAGFDKWDKNFT